MWVLCDNHRWPDKQFRLLCDRDLSVGRQQVIALGDEDKSISRRHAVLRSDSDGPHSSPPPLNVTDLSKYGTFVNGERVETGGPRVLVQGDRLRFGLQWHEWRVEWRGAAVLASLLPRAQLLGPLPELVSALGLRLEASWSEQLLCVIMPEFRLSVKAVQALASAVPVVTVSFLAALRQVLGTDAAAGDPPLQQHLPPMAEPVVGSECGSDCLLPRRERCCLFAGCRFVFAGGTRQMARLQLAVQLAGGQVQLLEDTPVGQLADAGVLVVKATTDQQLPGHVQKQLLAAGKRAIEEQEVGVALVRCSTERECNAVRHCDGSLVCAPDKQPELRPVTVLAPDSEAARPESTNSPRRVVSETPDDLPDRSRRLYDHADGSVFGESTVHDPTIVQLGKRRGSVGQTHLDGDGFSNDSTKRRRLETGAGRPSESARDRQRGGSTAAACTETEQDIMNLFDAEELVLEESQLDDCFSETGDRHQVTESPAKSLPAGGALTGRAGLLGHLGGSQPREKGAGDRVDPAGGNLRYAGTPQLRSADRSNVTVKACSKSDSDAPPEAMASAPGRSPDRQRGSGSSSSVAASHVQHSQLSGPVRSGTGGCDGGGVKGGRVARAEADADGWDGGGVGMKGGRVTRAEADADGWDGGEVGVKGGCVARAEADADGCDGGGGGVKGGRVARAEADADGWLSRVAGLKLEVKAPADDSGPVQSRAPAVVVTSLLRAPVHRLQKTSPSLPATQNFKRFRAKAADCPMVRIIGGSDLYVHSRGATGENLLLDEAGEEEHPEGWEKMLEPLRPARRQR